MSVSISELVRDKLKEADKAAKKQSLKLESRLLVVESHKIAMVRSVVQTCDEFAREMENIDA